MNISIDNYEAYFLDYYDNSLSPEQTAELMLFLGRHPELLEEFESFEEISIVPDLRLHFPGKDTLKKNIIVPVDDINEKNYENLLISSVEGVLSPDESSKLELFLIQNPHLRKELELYHLTILQADTNIVFKNKAELKRGAMFEAPHPATVNYTRWLYTAVSIAALLVIFFAIYPDINKKPVTRDIANNSHQEKPVVKSGENTDSGKTSVLIESSGTKTAVITKAIPVKNTQIAENNFSGQPVKNEEYIYSLPILNKELTAETDQISSINIDNRTYFTEIYEYIKIREDIEYLQYMSEREDKPAIVRLIGNFREKVLGIDMKDDIQQKNTGLWALAEAGIKGYNFVTNSNVRLNRRTDDEGRTLSYAISTEKLEYSKKVKSYQDSMK